MLSSKLLILGKNGQLGKEFCHYLKQHNITFTAYSHQELDVCDHAKTRSIILASEADILLNCTAYNKVDLAEEDEQTAYAVNALAVANLTNICANRNIKLVHFSTDYVFDGEKKQPYTEADAAKPLNIYGKSKLAGEESVSKYDNSLILRTSWLYGKGEQNFVNKILTLLHKQQDLQVSCDEFSVPTSCNFLVSATINLLNKNLSGTYHVTNSGYCSRFTLARAICNIKAVQKFIYPAYKADFALAATRAKFSVMSNAKLAADLQISITDWRQELHSFLNSVR